MSDLKDKFEKLLKEKGIPCEYQVIEEGHHLFNMKFQANKNQILSVEVILQETEEEYSDAQIIYRHVHGLADYNKQADALKIINELNEMKTGYYLLHLAGDGEIFLKSLIRSGQNPEPIYETLVFGSGIARGLQPILKEELGSSAQF